MADNIVKKTIPFIKISTSSVLYVPFASLETVISIDPRACRIDRGTREA